MNERDIQKVLMALNEAGFIIMKADDLHGHLDRMEADLKVLQAANKTIGEILSAPWA